MPARALAVAALMAAAVAAGLPSPAAANHAQTDSGNVVVFDHKTGNEWWVEVLLSGQDAGSVASVEVRDDGGPWIAMAYHPEWAFGDWAASFRVEPGHRVQFRATWAGGAQQMSCWFTHPAGVEQCGTPPPPPPPPPTFDATFSNVKGNEWWAEAVIKANTPIHAVLLDICGSGMESADMVYRADWGKWVLGGVRIPSGSTVVMTAIGDGGSDASGGYVWPQATATSGCGSPPPRFGADFRNPKGNEWWVEVTVMSRESLAGVDARLGCSSGPGSWIPLTLRSWGNWAASFRVPPGTHVDFRARATNGLEDISDNAYVWPAATPTDACDKAWPRDSSFAQVRFRVEDRWFDVDGEHYRLADGLVSTRFSSSGGGFWDGTCEQRVSTRAPDGTWTNVTETHAWDAVPPFGQVPATVGGVADVQQVENCALTHVLDQPVVGRERRAFSIRTTSGDPVPIDAYHAANSGTGFNEHWWWDAKHGLMLDWDLDSFGSSNTRHADGWLLNTDATFG